MTADPRKFRRIPHFDAGDYRAAAEAAQPSQ
jgi:hypothetical protein